MADRVGEGGPDASASLMDAGDAITANNDEQGKAKPCFVAGSYYYEITSTDQEIKVSFACEPVATLQILGNVFGSGSVAVKSPIDRRQRPLGVFFLFPPDQRGEAFILKVPAGIPLQIYAQPGSDIDECYLPFEQEITLSPGETRLLTISFSAPPVTYSAKVTDENGAPLEGAVLRVSQRGGFSCQKTTGPDGTFQLFAPYGSVSLTISRGNYLPKHLAGIPVQDLPAVIVLEREKK